MVLPKTVKVALGAVVVSALTAGAALAEIKDLTGRVSYREKIALPPDSLVEVTLEDVSKMDIASTVLASQTLRPDGQVPVDFRLSYDDGMVDARGRYAVRALIRVGDTVLWRSTQSFPALTHDAPETIDVVVEKMVQQKEVALVGSEWLVVKMGGEDIQTERLPQMVFGADGRVSGTSGCNRFSGSYIETNGQVSFGPMASTRMACAGALGDQEVTFFKLMSQVAAVGTQAGFTVLLNEQGDVVMQLAKP